MCVEAVLIHLQKGNGDIRAVICDPLVVRRDIRQDKACLDIALALAETSHMASIFLQVEAVDDFLERLDLFCKAKVAVLEREHCHIHDAPDRVRVNQHFLTGLCRESELFLMETHRRLLHVERMVCDPLEIIDRVKQNRQRMAVPVRHRLL